MLITLAWCKATCKDAVRPPSLRARGILFGVDSLIYRARVLQRDKSFLTLYHKSEDAAVLHGDKQVLKYSRELLCRVLVLSLSGIEGWIYLPLASPRQKFPNALPHVGRSCDLTRSKISKCPSFVWRWDNKVKGWDLNFYGYLWVGHAAS